MTLETQREIEAKDELEFKKRMRRIVLIIKAGRGEPIDPDSVITQLTDIKNVLERTRFPTYPMLGKHVYLRLIADMNTNAKACYKWSEKEASALISYKGQSRAEVVEMNKAPQIPQQSIYLNPQQQAQQQTKTHFWNRPKKEASEFNE